jgi:hypothetical protein
MFKSIEVKKVSLVSEEEYFGDKERIGSSDYSLYTENEAEYIYSLKKDRSESSSMQLGSLFHQMICGDIHLKDYAPDDKYKTTSKKRLKEGFIGANDYHFLSLVLDNFPLDLKKLESDCDIFEREHGYHLDLLYKGEELKIRVKPDVLFQKLFCVDVNIIDWKTASGFFRRDPRPLQAQFYCLMMWIILSQREMSVSSFNFYTWEINTQNFRHEVLNIFQLESERVESLLTEILDSCIEIKKLMINPNKKVEVIFSSLDPFFEGYLI